MAPQHFAPELVRSIGEHVAGLCIEYEPGASIDFAFELTGAPPRIAAEDSDFVDRGGHDRWISGEVGGGDDSHDWCERFVVDIGIFGRSERDQRRRFNRSTLEH